VRSPQTRNLCSPSPLTRTQTRFIANSPAMKRVLVFLVVLPLLADHARGRLELVLLSGVLRAEAPAGSLSVKIRVRTVIQRGVHIFPHPNIWTAGIDGRWPRVRVHLRQP